MVAVVVMQSTIVLLVTVISMQGLALAKSDGKQKQTLTIHVNMSV